MELRSGKKMFKIDYKLEQEKLLEFMSGCTVNNTDIKSVDCPFFKGPSEEIDITDLTTKLKSEYVEFMNEYNFPLKLKLLYLILGNESKELHYNGFVFMDIKTIKDRVDNYKNLFDIGFIYRGMGHIMALSMTKTKSDNQLFLRLDGGSNGFDREHNYKFFKDIEIKDIGEEKMFNTTKLFEYLTQNNMYVLASDYDFIYKYVSIAE